MSVSLSATQIFHRRDENDSKTVLSFSHIPQKKKTLLKTSRNLIFEVIPFSPD
jgi:hypothetical protein